MVADRTAPKRIFLALRTIERLAKIVFARQVLVLQFVGISQTRPLILFVPKPVNERLTRNCSSTTRDQNSTTLILCSHFNLVQVTGRFIIAWDRVAIWSPQLIRLCSVDSPRANVLVVLFRPVASQVVFWCEVISQANHLYLLLIISTELVAGFTKYSQNGLVSCLGTSKARQTGRTNARAVIPGICHLVSSMIELLSS